MKKPTQFIFTPESIGFELSNYDFIKAKKIFTCITRLNLTRKNLLFFKIFEFVDNDSLLALDEKTIDLIIKNTNKKTSCWWNPKSNNVEKKSKNINNWFVINYNGEKFLKFISSYIEKKFLNCFLFKKKKNKPLIYKQIRFCNDLSVIRSFNSNYPYKLLHIIFPTSNKVEKEENIKIFDDMAKCTIKKDIVDFFKTRLRLDKLYLKAEKGNKKSFQQIKNHIKENGYYGCFFSKDFWNKLKNK